MINKERSVDDYVDLGCLLKAADEAVIAATVLVSSMYPKNSVLRNKRLAEISKDLRDLRDELDGRRTHDLTVEDTTERTHPRHPFHNGIYERPKAYAAITSGISQLAGGRQERARRAKRAKVGLLYG